MLMPCERPMFLHHTFVAALLNDLFGIQCRAGCVCAGPYAMDLLGIDEPLAKLYEDALVTRSLENVPLFASTIVNFFIVFVT